MSSHAKAMNTEINASIESPENGQISIGMKQSNRRLSHVCRNAKMPLPGKASLYIRHLLDLPPGMPVILACRVSGCSQKHNENLDDHDAWLAMVAEGTGHPVLQVPKELEKYRKWVGSGFDPRWLAPLAAWAKEQGAALLAETTDRFIRNPAYHSKWNPDVQASEIDLEQLRLYTDGAVLATYLHPDATPHEVRSQQRIRGKWAKKHMGGRGNWKEDKYGRGEKMNRQRTLVCYALAVLGCSYAETAAFVNFQMRKKNGISKAAIRAQWRYIRDYGFQPIRTWLRSSCGIRVGLRPFHVDADSVRVGRGPTLENMAAALSLLAPYRKRSG